MKNLRHIVTAFLLPVIAVSLLSFTKPNLSQIEVSMETEIQSKEDTLSGTNFYKGTWEEVLKKAKEEALGRSFEISSTISTIKSLGMESQSQNKIFNLDLL